MSLSVELPGPVVTCGAPAAGLAVLASARWPGTRADELPAVAGFVTSGFSPLVAAVSDLCLTEYFGAPPAEPEPRYTERTAIVLVSSTGDLVTSAAVADAVRAGRRVPPLLFYQSNHNAVAGYVAKYGQRIESYGWSLQSMARDYPHVIKVTPRRIRAW